MLGPGDSAFYSIVQAQAPPTKQDASADEPPPSDQPTPKVEVKPVSLDEEIAARLERILKATAWFENPRVTVSEGVVFLEGTTTTDDRKEWAAKLASNTEDVVAVANRIRVTESSIWDFAPAWNEIDTMRRNTVQRLPTFVLSVILLVLTYFVAKGFSLLARRIIARRTDNPLLREVLTKVVTIPVVLFGLFLALRVTGLTQLAMTILGGTGLIGLIIGIAFRDIAENFLASLLISMQRPFRAGDNILVEGRTGIVQAVTTRGTTIMTPDGNHVRIPNSIIYKSIIENLTANPKQRVGFTLSIDTKSSFADSQAAILDVLKNHEAVLQEPEPLVLVQSMSRQTAILRVFFWLDVQKHSKDKVRSAIIRLSKMALQELAEKEAAEQEAAQFNRNNTDQQAATKRDHAASTPAEGTLESDTAEIQKQARDSRSVEDGTDLLKKVTEAVEAG
jgi:small-conductance mechanosensitive channel